MMFYIKRKKRIFKEFLSLNTTVWRHPKHRKPGSIGFCPCGHPRCGAWEGKELPSGFSGRVFFHCEPCQVSKKTIKYILHVIYLLNGVYLCKWSWWCIYTYLHHEVSRTRFYLGQTGPGFIAQKNRKRWRDVEKDLLWENAILCRSKCPVTNRSRVQTGSKRYVCMRKNLLRPAIMWR